jgi:molecular chaperone DnaK
MYCCSMLHRLSLGIETMGGVMTKLIEANTTIPTKKAEVLLQRHADNQPSVEIHVLQGERPLPLATKPSEVSTSMEFRRRHAAVPQIEVAFDIDANGILHVHAKDKATGKSQSDPY